MIRAWRRYKVPAALAVFGLLGLWVAWRTYSLHVVNSDIPTGTICAAVVAVASFFLLYLKVFIILKRRAFLALNPFVILATYVSVTAILLLLSANLAFMTVVHMLKSVT